MLIQVCSISYICSYFPPVKSVIVDTAGVVMLFTREDELGKIKPAYVADCI